jgi:hypothetical protein
MSPPPSPEDSAPHRAVLTGLLATSWSDLRRLQGGAENLGEGGRGALSRDQLDSLCGFLAQASANLEGRITDLEGAAGARLAASRPGGPGEPHLPLRSLVGACRSCCLSLESSLEAAKLAGDSITARLLGELVLRLENQLWLLDPQAGAG